MEVAMARTPKSIDGQAGPAKPRRPSTRKPNGDTQIPNVDTQVPDDEVARRAYEIYQSRGGHDGADMDDWLEAERQLKSANRQKPSPAD